MRECLKRRCIKLILTRDRKWNDKNWTAHQSCKKRSHAMRITTKVQLGGVLEWEIFFRDRLIFKFPLRRYNIVFGTLGGPRESFARLSDPKHHGCRKSTSWWTEHEGVSFITVPVTRKLWNEKRLALVRRTHGAEGKHIIAAGELLSYLSWYLTRCLLYRTPKHCFTGFRLV